MEVINETDYYNRIYNKLTNFASLSYAHVSTKFIFF